MKKINCIWTPIYGEEDEIKGYSRIIFPETTLNETQIQLDTMNDPTLNSNLNLICHTNDNQFKPIGDDLNAKSWKSALDLFWLIVHR